MRPSYFIATTLYLSTALVAAQQIFDVYTTTFDQKSLFAYKNLGDAGSSPINFVAPGPDGQATISIDDSKVFQTVNGFGATLTDTATAALLSLKAANGDKYKELLTTMFDPSDDKHNAGLSFLRVTLGASDLSSRLYTFDDAKDDAAALKSFALPKEATDTLTVIKDIMAINSILQVHLVPWSPPASMKTTNSMKGGGIVNTQFDNYASYLLKAVQSFKDGLGKTPFAVAIQNEPQNPDGSYPTCTMSPDEMGQIGTKLRTLLDSSSLKDVRIIGYEHNWDNAGTYPVELMQKHGDAFAGVAFHCYAGKFTNQAAFTAAFPDKEVYFTECTGTIGSDFWTDIKFWMDNLHIGSVEQGARTSMMWNLAADDKGGPVQPGTDSCGGGCRPVVTITGGSYTLNQEFWALAQAQKATLPKDVGGPMGKRIGVSVGGDKAFALRVGAYVTARTNANDFLRYSLVVMNWDDSANSKFNPVDVPTTINFRGQQASYTFPVGVTTLYWFATSNGKFRRDDAVVHVEYNGAELPSIKLSRFSTSDPVSRAKIARTAANATRVSPAGRRSVVSWHRRHVGSH